MTEHKILIVEDNHEIRDSLRDILELNDYQAEVASDGVEALQTLEESKFDLIISDIMMPNMDGFEMVEAINERKEFDHIPIIYLTAKVQANDRLMGLKLGANDYITKPFEMNELLLKVKNLLRLRSKITETAYSDPPRVNVQSKKDIFLRNLNLAIEDDIKNVNFLMDDLANKLGISASSLQKKLKSIAGKSVSQYIREYRLKRANQLIISDYGSLSEIAKSTGFRSLSYFSKTYKNFYGVPPSKSP
jgi:DNA-binding response OmpR family regulator